MESLLVSFDVAALAEVADKTQLLSLPLAAYYRKPWPIIAAFSIATLLNLGLTDSLGMWPTQLIGTQVLGLLFLAMAAWFLTTGNPDEKQLRFHQFSVFGTTLALFLLAEIGNTKQITTLALIAEYEAPVSVVLGSMLGMLIASAPVVFLGAKLTRKLPDGQAHAIASPILASLGLAVLFGWIT